MSCSLIPFLQDTTTSQGKSLTPWEVIQRDPSWMRVGDFQVAHMGLKARSRMEQKIGVKWEGEGREKIRRRLEEEFLEGKKSNWFLPGMKKPQITKIVDPEFYARPFIWTSKDQSPSSCPLNSEAEEEKTKPESEDTEVPRSRLPRQVKGMKGSEEEGREHFKTWEEHEHFGRMREPWTSRCLINDQIQDIKI